MFRPASSAFLCFRLSDGRRITRTAVAVLGFVLAGQCSAQLAAPRRDVVAMYLFHGADEATYKRQLEQHIELRIARIAEVTQLSEAQTAKLRMAAQGDLSRFYREISRVSEATKHLNVQVPADMQQAWREVLPLQQRAANGILDEKSLLEKVLSSMLTPAQRDQFDDYLRERQVAQYKSIVRMTVADLEKSLPLTDQQRIELIKLVESKSFPRKVVNNYEALVGYGMLLRLTKQETEALFDVDQQKVFSQLRLQYGAYANGFQW